MFHWNVYLIIRKSDNYETLCYTASAILSLPSVTQKVISIDTENTQLILQVMHYGENVGDPSQFLYHYTGRGNDYGDGPMTYPTVGGGSSTLCTDKLGVINHPSDNKKFDHDGERSVPNLIIVK